MYNISVFKKIVKNEGVRTLPKIVTGIRGRHFSKVVTQIRKAVERGDKEETAKLKKDLLGFTVSGEFSGGRRMEFLKEYNPLVVLDIDKLEKAVLVDVVAKIKKIEFTKVAFISPSGRGVKIIVSVDSEVQDHRLAYKQVADFYEEVLGVEIDRSGKDVTRLCFMSYDPKIYFNPESEVFRVVKREVWRFSISPDLKLNPDDIDE